MESELIIKVIILTSQLLLQDVITIMSVNLYFSQSTSFLIQSMQKQILAKRVFGQSLRQNQLKKQEDLIVDLKPRGRKHVCITQPIQSQSIHPQMNYFNEIATYCLSQIKKVLFDQSQSKKIKNDIEAMLSNDYYDLDKNNNSIFAQFEAQSSRFKKQKKYFFSEEIDFDARFTLVQWMISLHRKFKLRQQTLHIAINLVDNFAKKFPVKLAEYQLLGVSALFLAGKYEEINTPVLKYFVSVCDKLYTKDQILSMESQILIKCNFNISKNISTLWFLNTFGINSIVFGENVFKNKTKNSAIQNKQNQNSSNITTNDEIHQNFLKKCRYILNLVLLDFSLRDQQNDLISISVLIFVSMLKQFANADSHKILNNYFQYKQKVTKLTKAELRKKIKFCNDKIQKIYQNRFQNKFISLNQKFGIDIQAQT